MNTKQIEYFFKQDFPRLSLMATGRCLSVATIKTTKINTKEKEIYDYYQNVFSIVNRAIAKLENTPVHPYKTLIIERYIKQTITKDLPFTVGYKSESYTLKRVKEALICFATEYNKQADKYNLKFKF